MISRAYLKNWKSHHETELEFSPGVNVLVGEMGSGKSSVLEAICFALYGTTPALQSRRVTLDDLLRRTPSPANEAVVEVDFQHGGTVYTVRREVEREKGTTTSELRRDGELLAAPQANEVTEEVADILGIGYDLFSRAIYSEQNELDYFLDLRAGDRKEKIDELLNLDRFETARSTLVSLINRLGNRKDDRQEDLEALEDELEESAVEDLEEKVEDVEEDISDLREEREDVSQKLEEERELLDELQERKREFEEMKEKRTALQTRIETLEERIQELAETAGEYAGKPSADIEDLREELEDEKAELEEREDRISELQNELELLEEKEEELLEEKEELEEKVDDLERLGEVEERLEQAREELEDARSERARAKARLQEVGETLQNLSGASEECPTCGQELTEEHRVRVLKENKEAKEELEETLQQDDTEELEERIEELEEGRDRLVELKGAEERLEKISDSLGKMRQDREQKETALEELLEDYPEERFDRIDAEVERLGAAAEAAELEEEKEERVKELEDLERAMEDSGFDEDRLDAVRDGVNDLEKQKEVMESKVEGLEEVLAERRARLAEAEKKQDRVEEYRSAVEEYRDKIEVMTGLKHGLEATQTDLRERFVASVNEVMEEVWDRIYPYGDYRGIRLNAQEDYGLELLDREGNWISVQGEVSGGERHSSALSLRIAFSIVLSPSWRVLMLDEPTHNLDVTAIEDLSDTLRTRVSELVDQLFLITHEERLETAATGDLYKLSKKETGTGLTEVEPAAVE